MTYVPYETLARIEASDIVMSLPTSLGGLSIEQLADLQELLAGAYGSGLEIGLSMSDFNGDTPGDVAEAYVAGYEQGKTDKGE